MGDNITLSNSKNQKQKVFYNAEDGIDRISKLPDFVLQHILSFLPTEDAVGTTILSKRWEYMWTSIPNLDFVNKPTKKRKLFLNFVDRVLSHRDFSNLKRFSLQCDVLYDASHINTWISAAIRRKVQDLIICLSEIEEQIVLPFRLFTCESVSVLELHMPCFLKLPPLICFASLKSLTLAHVIFPNDYLTQQLFLGCPVLEELCLHECNWVHLKAVSVPCPKLKKLTIFEKDTNEWNSLSGCQVVIFGTSLQHFSYQGDFQNDYCLCCSSSLFDASICVENEAHGLGEGAHRLHKLIRGLSNVKKLALSSDAVRDLTGAKELFTHLPAFDHLNCLLLDFAEIDCDRMPKILGKFPYLRSLVFEDGIEMFDYTGEDVQWNPVPSCFLSCLKNIEVDDFDGTDSAIYAAEFLLEKAAVLNCLVISFSLDLEKDSEKQKGVRERLQNLPRVSPSCSVVFT